MWANHDGSTSTRQARRRPLQFPQRDARHVRPHTDTPARTTSRHRRTGRSTAGQLLRLRTLSPDQSFGSIDATPPPSRLREKTRAAVFPGPTSRRRVGGRVCRTKKPQGSAGTHQTPRHRQRDVVGLGASCAAPAIPAHALHGRHAEIRGIRPQSRGDVPRALPPERDDGLGPQPAHGPVRSLHQPRLSLHGHHERQHPRSIPRRAHARATMLVRARRRSASSRSTPGTSGPKAAISNPTP